MFSKTNVIFLLCQVWKSTLCVRIISCWLYSPQLPPPAQAEYVGNDIFEAADPSRQEEEEFEAQQAEEEEGEGDEEEDDEDE